MNKMLIIFLLIMSSAIFGAEERGLGIMLGNPTGLNGKLWLSGKHAVDGGLGVSIGKHTNFSMHSDYLFHEDAAFFFNDVHPLDLYYGIGARMEFADDIELGIRVPVGVTHRLRDQAADMFAEVAPVVDFLYHTGVEIHLAIGARYYFP